MFNRDGQDRQDKKFGRVSRIAIKLRNFELNIQYPTRNIQYPISNKEYPISNKEYPISNKEYPISNKEYPMSKWNSRKWGVNGEW
ncbi:MAG: hypothetical protein WCI51_21355 [Lentisphaerota bacterium]